MWQFVTVEAGDSRPTAVRTAKLLKMPIKKLRHLGVVTHALTHRRYHFDVFACEVGEPVKSDGLWRELKQLDQYPLTGPQLKIVEMLRGNS
jgi:adenine-specific DNA glycosylase